MDTLVSQLVSQPGSLPICWILNKLQAGCSAPLNRWTGRESDRQSGREIKIRHVANVLFDDDEFTFMTINGFGGSSRIEGRMPKRTAKWGSSGGHECESLMGCLQGNFG